MHQYCSSFVCAINISTYLCPLAQDLDALPFPFAAINFAKYHQIITCLQKAYFMILQFKSLSLGTVMKQNRWEEGCFLFKRIFFHIPADRFSVILGYEKKGIGKELEWIFKLLAHCPEACRYTMYASVGSNTVVDLAGFIMVNEWLGPLFSQGYVFNDCGWSPEWAIHFTGLGSQTSAFQNLCMSELSVSGWS